MNKDITNPISPTHKAQKHYCDQYKKPHKINQMKKI